MRLLHTTNLELHDFPDAKLCPSYAILSHVWTASETSFQLTCRFVEDLARHNAERKCPTRSADAHDSGTTGTVRCEISDKILNCCAFARANGHRYLWVDTCCIDKTSSAELTEAINSMAEWYTRAAVCYAYLHDVEYDENPKAPDSSFRRSKWFTRGWTLQELIFPDTVIFLSSNWRMIGTKALLSQPIFDITGICTDVLLHVRPLSSVSVAARMSWASRRQTTRVEDEAYCLLGIFEVYIPTIYGEGRHAFVRLQEEILRRIPDQTLFAWGPSASFRRATPMATDTNVYPSDHPDEGPDYDCTQSLFAPAPASFADYAHVSAIKTFNIPQYSEQPSHEYTVGSDGIFARFPCIRLRAPSGTILAILASHDDRQRYLALVLKEPDGAGVYTTNSIFYDITFLGRSLSRTGTIRILFLELYFLGGLSTRGFHILATRHSGPNPFYVPHTPPDGQGRDSSWLVGPCEIILSPWTLASIRQSGFECDIPGNPQTADCVGATSAAALRLPGDSFTYRLLHGSGRHIDINLSICKQHGDTEEPLWVALRVALHSERSRLPPAYSPRRLGRVPITRHPLGESSAKILSTPPGASATHVVLDVANSELSMILSFLPWQSISLTGSEKMSMKSYAIDITFVGVADTSRLLNQSSTPTFSFLEH